MVTATGKLESYIQSLPCGLLLLRQGTTIAETNTTLCNLLGYQQNELKDQPFEKLLTTASRIFNQTHFFPLLQLKEKADEIFFSLRHRDGSNVPVMVNATKQQEDYILVCLPVWQRQKYEEEILRAKRAAEDAIADNKVIQELQVKLKKQLEQNHRYINQLKNKNYEYVQLSKITSHNLVEPVRKLFVNLDVLNKKATDDLLPVIERITQQATQLRSVTFGLHRFVSTDFADEKVRKVSLLSIIQQATIRARKQTAYTDFLLRLDELPTIDGYMQQLEMMFYELLKNAIEFRAPGRDLYIEIKGVLIQENIFLEGTNEYKYGDFIRIKVIDNGTGFNSRYADYVFEVFNRLNKESSARGVGLPIAKKVAVKHNGTIFIESTEGVGTTVTILLPLEQPAF